MRSKLLNTSLALLVICCVCLSIFNVATIMNKKRDEVALASWSDTYENADELISDADVIIRGRLVEEIPELRIDMVFTYERVEVIDVYKGDILAGDVIDILQTGGEYDKISTPSIDDAPLFSEIIDETERETGELILCFKQTEYDEQYGSYYLICGGFQGVGMIANNNSEHQTVLSISDTSDTVMSDYPLEEFREKISDMNISSNIE